MNYLFTGIDSQVNGGTERFAARAADLLRANGHTVDVVFDAPEHPESYDRVVMQKIPASVAELKRLKDACGNRLRFFAHDHCLYCLRRHSYWPGRRLCDRSYSFFPCRLCAAVTRPAFLWRNLTYPIGGFLREMRGVKTYTCSAYMRGRLVASGLSAGDVSVVHPVFQKVTASPRTDDAWMPDGRLRLLFLGALVGGKGVGLLLDAFALVKTNCMLAVAGTGPDETALRERASQLPAHVKVDFLGWQAETAPLFAAADACVVPSLWHEPFGIVGAEASLNGIPAIAFDVGGVRDWLKAGVTGVFATDRSPEALAAAIDSLADRQRLATIGRSARAFAAEAYAPERFLEAFT